ncbi:family 43 glycosylhydrolase [Cohnella sp. LGH]|uniref:glycoside hydrolase family 32 protein n=1 Tax=Cohnella sp. LGH TaxID=1619153 RepID=UPI001ADA0CAB|nr:glycoside hydrolase family 32 protein [Cohnella sp. LGH]QTH42560.1 family 43 glycosylhydrolase [Cohnella sp. LGH]
MALRYMPEPGRMVADLIPFYDEGYYHAYYLKGFQEGTGWARHHTPWAHLRSKDLMAWEELPNALETGTQAEPDGGACFTGSVYREGETVHIFYTGFSPGHPDGREQIMHATSSDGIAFAKNPANPILRVGSEHYGYDEDFRDPFVFRNEEEGRYWMLFTAGCRHPVNGNRRGVIGLAVSDDLRNWRFEAPIYAPDAYPSLECPDLFRMGDTWYLLFSQFGRTEYRMADSPYGPWTRPANPYFDAGDYFFYAAKSCFDGADRYLFGWCGDLAEGKDAPRAMWGGTFVTPRKIVRAENGELRLACPDIYASSVTKSHHLDYNECIALCGEWNEEPNGSIASLRETGFAALVQKEAKEHISLRLTVSKEERTGTAGIVLRASDRLDNAYLLGLDYGAGTLRLERYRAVRAFHGSALDGERILCERPVPGLAAGDTDLLVFLQDNILEVFVNGVTMTVPLRDIRGGGLGLYTSDGSALFTLKS